MKLLGWRGQEIDTIFTRLTGAFVEATLEELLGGIIKERAKKLENCEITDIKLFYRNAATPPKQADILTNMITDSNPHIEQADFSTLRDFLAGHTRPNHYFVALVPSLFIGPPFSASADAALGAWLW